MKKLQGFLTVALVATILFAPFSLAHADSFVGSDVQVSDSVASSDVVITEDASTPPTVTADQDQDAELASLQEKVDDPSTGFFARIIMKLKIHQLENQITLKKALQ